MTPNELQSYVDVLGNGLNNLVSSMQMPAQKIWEIALRQNYFYAVMDWLWVLLFIVCLIMFIISFNIENKKEYAWKGETTIGQVASLIFGIVSFFLFIGSIFAIYDSTNRFINPEYKTSQDIINLVNGNSCNK